MGIEIGDLDLYLGYGIMIGDWVQGIEIWD